MKRITFLLLFIGTICNSYSQSNKQDLPSEFKTIAIEAFQKANPTTTKWFVEVAKQHPVGSFDSAWTKQKLKEKFSTAEIAMAEGLWMVMLEYQRMLNKESKQDRNKELQDRKSNLGAKESKISMENSKADNAMSAAQNALWTGIISSSSIANSPSNISENQNISNVQASRIILQKPDSNKLRVNNFKQKNQPVLKESEKTQIKITELSRKEESRDEFKKELEDPNKAIKDAIKKLLDQMAKVMAIGIL